MKVNPNTMQKALQELESINLIYTERTNGKYVTNDKKLINKYKEENDGIVTLFGPMKIMMPVILSILGVWILILIGWFLIGLPLGINSFPTL